MDQVAPDLNRKIATNGSGGSIGWIRCTNRVADHLDDTLARNSGNNHRAGSNIPDKLRKEGLPLVDRIMLPGKRLVYLDHLQSGKLQPTLFQPCQNRTGQTALNSVGLENNE